MRLYSRQISPLFLGLALLLFAAQEPRAQSPVAVTLLPGTSPAAAEPGVTTIAVTGSNFPAGTIPAANVTVSIAKAGGIGPTTGVKATAVATVTGTTRRVTFTVPSTISVVIPTSYVISIAGSTSTGVAFSSSNSAAMTVNPAASLSGVTPATGQPGQTLSVSVTGVFTNFLQGSTVAGFGAGITIVSLTVTNATHATASITLAANAAGGPRTVTMTTGVEVATQANGFTVQAPTLLSVNPNSGPQGQQNIPVTITGQFTHFSNASIVSFANLGVTAGAPTGATSTSITVPVSIGSAATLGVTNVTVTTGAEVVTLTNGFTVQPTPNRPPVVTSSGCSQTVSMMPSQVTVTEFAIPTANVGPGGITLGSDCNLWFAESRGNTVGRITPAGVITELPPFAAAGGAGSLSYITAGPDGNLWATDYSGGNIWRITTAGGPGRADARRGLAELRGAAER